MTGVTKGDKDENIQVTRVTSAQLAADHTGTHALYIAKTEETKRLIFTLRN